MFSLSSLFRTRFLVSVTLFLVCLIDPTIESYGYLFGVLINSLLSKLLKLIFNQERPATAIKHANGVDIGSGFPSSHAQALYFLTTLFSATAALEPHRLDKYYQLTPILRLFAVLAVQFGSFLMSRKRVVHGLHTWPQVIAGCLFGVFFGLIHFCYSFPWLRSYFGSNPVFDFPLDNPIICIRSLFLLLLLIFFSGLALERNFRNFMFKSVFGNKNSMKIEKNK